VADGDALSVAELLAGAGDDAGARPVPDPDEREQREQRVGDRGAGAQVGGVRLGHR